MMRSPLPTLLRLTTVIIVVVGLVAAGKVNKALEVKPAPDRAPEFTHRQAVDWINTEPLRMADLRGKVLLIDFWTFECWNCYRSFPWLNSIDQRFASDGLQIIGVHSPEFEREHDRQRVKTKVEEFSLHHPVMIDNDFSYWRAFNNRFWPTFYLIDKRGAVRGRYIGETHIDDERAKTIEQHITQLLAESA